MERPDIKEQAGRRQASFEPRAQRVVFSYKKGRCISAPSLFVVFFGFLPQRYTAPKGNPLVNAPSWYLLSYKVEGVMAETAMSFSVPTLFHRWGFVLSK